VEKQSDVMILAMSLGRNDLGQMKGYVLVGQHALAQELTMLAEESETDLGSGYRTSRGIWNGDVNCSSVLTPTEAKRLLSKSGFAAR